MATLYISYFGAVREHCAGGPVSSETVTTSTTSAASGTVPRDAKVASIYSDTAHYVAIADGGKTATATNGFYLPANTMRDLSIGFNTAVSPKISAITLA